MSSNLFGWRLIVIAACWWCVGLVTALVHDLPALWLTAPVLLVAGYLMSSLHSEHQRLTRDVASLSSLTHTLTTQKGQGAP